MAKTLAPGTVVAARYRIESVIGEGGMGAVYLVQHVHTDERLAMKVLHAQVLRDDGAVERFRREARAPARVQSEHVARVTDADTAPELGGAPFYVMEYLRGSDLDAIVRDVGPLPPATVVEYMRQTARALDKAHGIGIVHRDLKPENLFLTTREDGTPCVKLLDFGIAKLAGPIELPTELKTQTGTVFGTPAFMSPEQTKGEIDQVGPPADIWAFGLIAFKLLTGKDYWQAHIIAQLYVEILAGSIVPPSERGAAFGPAFDAWFARCVVRDIPSRFATAGEAAAALADSLGIELPRASVASLAWMSYDPTAVDVAHKTQGWPPAMPPRTPPVQLAADEPETTEPPAPPANKFPTGIVVGACLALVAVIVGVGATMLRSSAETARPAATASAEATAPSAAPSETASAASAAPEPTVAPAASAEPSAQPDDGKKNRPAPTSTARKPVSDDAPKPEKKGTSDDQRRRLEALQRLCDSGTVPAGECAAKRAAILRSSN